MKSAGIISIGTEIMRGKIDDTNSTYISRWLKDCGIRVKYRLSVEDVIDDIVNAIEFIKSSDLIILTGGLGPTDDDLTREALAKFLKKKLVYQSSEYQKIVGFFHKLNRPVAESNKKQVELVEGGEFLNNEFGTAPGAFYEENGKVFVLLPGPPKENQPMIQNQLFPKLKKNGFIECEIFTKIFRLYNVGESTIADHFKNFKEDIELGYYFTNGGWCEIHLSKYITDKDQTKNITPIIEKAESILRNNNIFYTDDKSITEIILNILQEKKLTLSFAESITGGNLSGEFVKNQGVSIVFSGGVVSYSNELKKNLLGVTEKSLINYGAVSEQVVKEMAQGVKKITGSNIAVSISGIAGPDGGSKEKPIGLVYFGFLFGNELFVKKEIFLGVRSRIIERSIIYVYVEILKYLINNI